jgi:hypothetical protein
VTKQKGDWMSIASNEDHKGIVRDVMKGNLRPSVVVTGSSKLKASFTSLS